MGGWHKTVTASRWHECLCRKTERINKQKTTPGTKSNYSKAGEYKVNVQSTTAFPYSNKKTVEFEIKNTTPLTFGLPKLNTWI